MTLRTPLFVRLNARLKALSGLLAAILFAAGTACAPALADPAPEDETMQDVQPLPEGGNLSEELQRRNGVIVPPPTGDTDIYTEAPDPAPGTTPVIPPEELPEQQ